MTMLVARSQPRVLAPANSLVRKLRAIPSDGDIV